MIAEFFQFLEIFEDHLWGYVGVPILLFVGVFLTLQSRFFQIRKLPYALKNFVSFLRFRGDDARGVHPLKAFFACVGGCVGVGNIAGICSAVQIGGPGALFWIWVTALMGMMVKYGEVYLGLRYRVPNEKGGYNGGPMYYLRRVFKSAFVPNLVCLLLCIYGVEVWQFSVVNESIVTNLHWNPYLVTFGLLLLVLYAGSGGIHRVGTISTALIPIFVLIYLGMGVWVLLHHVEALPQIFKEILFSAFTGSAALGGFVGSTLMMAMSQGVRRGCYTGDLGVGYASIIHSESCVTVPEQQASLAIVDIFLDTFAICTTSVLIILATGVWHEPISSGMMVQRALEQYFPYMHFFMPFFLFLLGYSTINAYFCVGLKCAEYLLPSYGRRLYFVYAAVALFLFSFVSTMQAQTVMTIANGLLLMINCYGIFKLRHEISYQLQQKADVNYLPQRAQSE